MHPATPANPVTQLQRELLGRVVAVSGSQLSVGLSPSARTAPAPAQATVGKFLGIVSGGSVIITLITEIGEHGGPASNGAQAYASIAKLDLVGEIKAGPGGAPKFQRGVLEYPSIGDAAVTVTDRELQLVFGASDPDTAQIGHLQQDTSIPARIKIDELLSRHFAILGTTGVGKSSGVAIILNEILNARPNLRIFLIDAHNEYGRCFGERAQVLTPRNLRLPFWLFNFEETIDAFFGDRSGFDEEIEILSDVIPAAKAHYLQYRRSTDRQLVKKRDLGTAGYTADTPVPYRIEDLIALLDERMGKLENRASRMKYHKLIARIQTFRNHPRYSFMFENANIGGDTMAEVLSCLFRLPPDGKPMTIMQLAGFPAEVVDSVVSVLCRMAFDFGLWSDGIAPLLFVCEEAHRYAPANTDVGFGPTRRALSRIAKEGRKYGVYLGLITQRPAEIDATIISQCSTLFVMRMSNDRDQEIIRSAVSDAAATLLSFIPSLGTGEVFAFGAGVMLPTRMKFRELPPELRPASEAAGDTRSNVSATADRDMIASVIERWRSASMSHKTSFEEDGLELPRDENAPLQPSIPASALDPQRLRSLKSPLARRTTDNPAPPPTTTTWR